MARWSAAYPLPKTNGKHWMMVNIGKNIWMTTTQVCSIHKAMQIFVFDTEIRRPTNFEINCQEEISTAFLHMTSHKNTIYLLGVSSAGLFMRVFTLNTETLQLERMDVCLSFPTSNIQIIGDFLYGLQIDPFEAVIEINMTTEMVEHILLDNNTYNSLMVNDDKLYVIANQSNGRTVSVIENGEAIQIHEQMAPTDGDYIMIYENGFAKSINTKRIVSFEKFDPQEKKWHTASVEACRYEPMIRRFPTCVQIGEKVYSLVALDEHTFELRCLELQPDLVTISLFNVVDAILKGLVKLDDVKNSLPEILSSQLSSMVDWRLREKAETDAEEKRRRFEELDAIEDWRGIEELLETERKRQVKEVLGIDG